MDYKGMNFEEYNPDLTVMSAAKLERWKLVLEDYRQHTLTTLSTRKEGDICVSLSKSVNMVGWSTKESINNECKIFYKLRKRGHIILREGNNGKVKMPNGKTYHFFVVQHTDPTKDTPDMFADAQHIMVKGNVYFFTRKANRDALYQYIMGV